MRLLVRELQRAPRAENPHHVLFYGKLQSVKGVENFVRACLELARMRPHLRFLLIGSDTRLPSGGSMREALRAAIGEELSDRFRFVDHIKREELPKFAAKALCAVIPSRSESFCLAAHELHHLACPLVLSNIPAFRGAFRDESTALLFEPDDLGSLVSAIERLAADPGLRERLASSKLTYQSTSEAYVDLPRARVLADGVGHFAMSKIDALGAGVPRPSPAEEPRAGLRERVSSFLRRVGRV
jgi:glycosyltransferase involved in cell wall biosynthesis